MVGTQSQNHRLLITADKPIDKPIVQVLNSDAFILLWKGMDVTARLPECELSL